MPVTSANITGSDQDNTDSTGIRGGTDGTVIGNEETDRLKASTNIKAKRNQGTLGHLADPQGVTGSVLEDVTSDKFGRLETFSLVQSDRSFFREDFSGSSLVISMTGTLTFTTSSTAVTGSGTAFTTETKIGQYIRLQSGTESDYRQIKSIESDTALTLVAAYGTGGSGSGYVSAFNIETPTGGSVAAASSILTVGSGTTSGAIGGVYRTLEGSTLSISFINTTISQRIANQTISIGLRSGSSTASRRAEFSFSGTDNTTFSCITSSTTAAANIETSTAYYPRGITSVTANTIYKISVLKDRVHFYVNDVLVATNRYHMAEIAFPLRAYILINNTGAAGSNTNVTCDCITSYQNHLTEVVATGSPLEVRGRIEAMPTPSIMPCYMAASGAFTPPATPTDMFYMVGNSTRWIRVHKICFSATQTTAGTNAFYLKKYSTAHSGGTRTFMTPVPLDSQNLSSVAGAYYYTANPTLGTLVGSMDIQRVLTPAVTSLIKNPIIVWDFVKDGLQPPTLRSASEGISINFNGAALPAGLSVAVTVYWSEEVPVW